jgi:redox-sensitive bicupin YhaK (pirin superfamily)
MIAVRPSADRGHLDHGWLDTFHTFSFGDYHDPEHVRFRTLRVLNEDFVAGGEGFGMHPHRDMESVTVVLEGALRHEDSMGNGSVIRPGDVQRMSAGTGVLHSEANDSPSKRVHLLQIWILPERQGLRPGYEQVALPEGATKGRLLRIASRKPGPGEVTIHQDASIHRADLAAGESVEHRLAEGRGAWVQVFAGSVEVGGIALRAGDGAAVEDEELVRIASAKGGSFLLFDLA